MVVLGSQDIRSQDIRRRMPFISQDWRGPGEEWIKSQDGWEIRRMAVRDRVEVRDRGEEETKEVETDRTEEAGVVKRRRTKTEGDAGENTENMMIRLVILWASKKMT